MGTFAWHASATWLPCYGAVSAACWSIGVAGIVVMCLNRA